MENDGNVREMTRTEKNFFNGVTIDASSTQGSSSEENFRTYNKNYEYRTRTAYVSYGVGSFVRALLNGNRLAQIGAFIIGLAFAALMFFVALPILFILLAIGIAFVTWAKILR